MKRIAGTISRREDEKNKKLVESMLSKLDHIKSDNLQASRLNGSVLGVCGKDLEEIDSPDKGKETMTVMDGDVYNLDALLSKNGVRDADSDSQEEKINKLFDKSGKEIFGDFKGSYAIVLKAGKDFILVRDVVGKKPLYYSIFKEEQKLLFGSEIKAFNNLEADINELKPGEILDSFDKPRTIKSINSDDFQVREDRDPAKINDRLNELLLESVGKRIGSDGKKPGVWLSGGVDSSIVAALLKEFSDNIYTFSVGFQGSPDLNSAKLVSDHLGTDHIEYFLDIEELIDMIPEVIYHLESFDAPLVRSSMGNFITAKLSSRSNIVFSGEGGDEVFGGYNYFLDLKSSKIIQEGLFTAINSLHNTALQRVDRLANANGVNIKLPLLDENLIKFALSIPPSRKVKKDIGTTKYVLREIADKYLPEEIAWRDKEKFWEGSGILTKLEEKIKENIDDEEFAQSKDTEEGFQLRSKEELYYYNIYKGIFPKVDFNKVLNFTSDF